MHEDISGTEAFDNVMDRLLDAHARAEKAGRERDEFRLQVSQAEAASKKAEQDLTHWRHQVGKLNSQIDRLRSLITPEQLAAFDNPLNGPDEIPF